MKGQPKGNLREPAVGIGYRRPIRQKILDNLAVFGCLEILAEQFMPLTKIKHAELEELADKVPLILHGVSLSLGGIQRPTEDYWSDLRTILSITRSPHFGEHLSISRSGGYDIWHLSPVWRTREVLAVCAQNIREAMDRLGVQLALETITEMFTLANSELAWAEFYIELCDATGAGLLVDVTNVGINIENKVEGFSPECLRELARVPWLQMHVGGPSEDHDGYIVDTHSSPVGREVPWLRKALKHAVAPYVIIERDDNLGEFETLLQDVEHVQAAIAESLAQR